jgi:putative ABC transport system permease protein
MLGTYSMLYTFPKTIVSGYWLYAAVSTLVVLLFAALAAVFSARKALKETPAQCMRPVPPKKVRQTLIERTRFWRRISYKNKLILRNILFNKQRAILSSIGIIGCVGVLLCGFGLREAAGDLYNVQFSQMQNFDDMVQLSMPAATGSPAPFDVSGTSRVDAYSTIPATISLQKDVSAVMYLLPQGSPSIRLDDIDGKPLALPADGILFPYKLAQQYHVKVGDTVKVRLESALYKNAEVNVRVSGIDVLYLSQDIYASYEYLQSLGVAPYVNGYYVSLGNQSDAAFASGVSGRLNVKSVVSKMNFKNTVESLMGMMDTFFLLMTVMSAALALAVIFNISSINIFERRRDIATLKVLGYHKREINSLVRVENFIITALGSVFGLAFGAVIYKYLLVIVVSQDMFFPYKISWATVALSVALAFAFTAFANWALKGKTRKIDMVESLKGVE